MGVARYTERVNREARGGDVGVDVGTIAPCISRDRRCGPGRRAVREAPRERPRRRPAAGPSRLLVFFCPNGTVPHRWRPVAAPADPLGFSNFAAGTILEPLRAIRKDLVVVDGLHFHRADNHEGGMAAMLTNGGGVDSPTGGASIDRIVRAPHGRREPLRLAQLGVQTSAWGGGIQTRMSYAKAGAWMTPDDDPHHVHERLFGVAGVDVEVLRHRRQSVIDLVRGEIVGLHARLGRTEQAKLEAHLESLRVVERGLRPGVDMRGH